MFHSPAEFRETVRRAAVGERKYIRYFDERGHFAHIKLQLIPRPGELCTTTRAPAFNIPDDCYLAARAGIFRKLSSGPLGHFPMHGIEVQLLEGTYLPRHSYPEAFAIAARMAFDEALLSASPVIVEPWTRIRLRAEPDALPHIFTTLTALLGSVDTSITLSDTFFLDVELPKRMLPRICHTFRITRPRTFPLDEEREYRPLLGAISAIDRPRPDMEDWT